MSFFFVAVVVGRVPGADFNVEYEDGGISGRLSLSEAPAFFPCSVHGFLSDVAVSENDAPGFFGSEIGLLHFPSRLEQFTQSRDDFRHPQGS